MPDEIAISAKTLGQLAMPEFCPRCFWLRMKAGRLPHQIFPGIFSTLDSYGKRLVNGWFARHAGPPPWLQTLGDIKRSINPPHYSKFFVKDPGTQIVLRGTPDAIFELRDGSHVIVDYKTAKFTAHQDELFPMYEAQLNAYAHIGERLRLGTVSKLALVYTEPVTGKETDNDSNVLPDGFHLDFNIHILRVKIKQDLVPYLLSRGKKILNSRKPPLGRSGCEDCAALAELFRLAKM